MNSSRLIDRDGAYVWHPYTQMRGRPAPLPVTHASGVYLYTEDGRRVLDGISSWWVNIHGHSHPRLNRALAAQAERLEHVIFASCTHPPAVDLAERLVAILPNGLTRVFYSDDGSTAVEVAVKMALQYWRNRGEPQRHTFIALEHGYHGDTVGAMSVSAESVFSAAFTPLLFPVIRAPAPYDASVERLLEAHTGDVAGVILEPMLQGAGGMIVWPAESLAAIRRLCDEHGVLLIADEVLTGFGRTGRMFACEHAAVTPDIICLSKALTAGYLPLGATVATEAVYEGFLSDDRRQTFFHGHSFTANPLACAVALASLDLFDEEPVLARVGRLEEQLRKEMQALSTLPCVGDVRVIGGVGVVELTAEGTQEGDEGYLATAGPRLAAAFLDRGLLLRPLGNVVYMMPPYAITDDEVHWMVQQVGDVLAGEEST